MMKLFLCMLISIPRSAQGYDLFLSPFIKPVVGLTWRSGWVFVESKIAKWKHWPVLVLLYADALSRTLVGVCSN